MRNILLAAVAACTVVWAGMARACDGGVVDGGVIVENQIGYAMAAQSYAVAAPAFAPAPIYAPSYAVAAPAISYRVPVQRQIVVNRAAVAYAPAVVAAPRQRFFGRFRGRAAAPVVRQRTVVRGAAAVNVGAGLIY
jgi:hypothetical protein